MRIENGYVINSKLILIGAGKRCQRICEIIKETNYEIVGIYDSNASGKMIEGYIVEPIDNIKLKRDVIWCITPQKSDIYDELYEICITKYALSKEKEIRYLRLIYELYLDSKKITYEHISTRDDSEKIVFFSRNGLNGGGVETYVKNTCLAYKKQNLSTQVNVFVGQYLRPNELTDALNVTFIEKGSENFESSEIQKVVSELIKCLPCVVVTSYTDTYMLGAALVKHAFPNDVRILSIVHNDVPDLYDNYNQWRDISDGYLAVSKDIRQKLELLLEPRIINNSTGPFYYPKELERTYTLDSKMPISIGYAGRLDGYEKSQKRMDLLLQLVRELDENGVNYEMEIAGDGPIKSDMEKQVTELGLDSKVHFWGMIPQKEIVDFWSKRDISVLLSDYEGRPISNLESMACGVVPIRTETSGAREDIVNGVNGFLVSIGDAHEAVGIVKHIEKNRNLLETVGINARNHIMSNCLIEQHILVINELLAKLTNELMS